MARLVKLEARGPLKVGDKFICRCGLAKGWQGADPQQPFCDGSHGKTRSEQEGKTYCYDAAGDQKEVTG